MALHAHLVASLDEVIPPLIDRLIQPTDDLFAHELIVVPSAGVQQWITEQLATVLGARAGARDGIVANLDTVFPGVLGSRLIGGGDREDPWTVARLTHTLVSLIAERPERVPESRRRDGPVSAARRTADLFDRYHFHRPGMILRWAADDPTLQEVAGEPTSPLPQWARWQFELWRSAQARIGAPSPPERTRDALARLRAGQRPERLPSRIFIVGVTGLPALHIEVLSALAPYAEIYAWFAHPSPGLLQATRTMLRDVPSLRIPLARHPAAQLARLPQISSWTRPSQSMQVLLAGAGITPALPPLGNPAAGNPMPLLHRVQQALRLDRADTPDPGTPVQGISDGSLQVHRAHGLTRQCEVLREALLHTLRELPDVNPREILVIAPNIADVAPHLEGVFPVRKPDTSPDPLALPLRVTDRSLARANEVAGLLDQLLELPESRAGLRELRALCAVPALRRALGVDEATVELWFTWAGALRVRWGLDGDHRATFGLPRALDVLSWQHALQRLVAGAVLDPEHREADSTAIPARGVEIGELTAIGALTRLLQLLTRFVDLSRLPRPVVEWCDLLLELLGALSKMPRNQDEPRARVLRLLSALRADAAGSTTPVAFAELRSLLAPSLAGDPPHVNLRSGGITATSLVPLRGVPFRVVCLVGVDEGAFSAGDGDGEDLLREHPLVGDPDPRGEQRQAFLDALLQATDRVIITCTGFDPRSNATVEPITPLSELLDVVHAVGGTSTEVIVDHPRHGADPRSFTSGALIPGVPFGHFETQLHASQHFRSAVPVNTDATALRPPSVVIPLCDDIPATDLIDALNRPLDLYAKRTLGLHLFEGEGDRDPTLPTTTEKQEYALAAQELLARLRGCDETTDSDESAARRSRWREAMAHTGWLPPLGLAASELDDAESLAIELIRQCQSKEIPLGLGHTVDVRIPLSDGRSVSASIGGVFDTGEYRHVNLSAERSTDSVMLRQLVLTWLLALHFGDTSLKTFYVGQNRGPKSARTSSYARKAEVPAQVSLDALRAGLESLVALHDEARRSPRPLFGGVADAVADGKDAEARRLFADWTSKQKPYYAEFRLYGAAPDFDVVFGDPDLRDFLIRRRQCESSYVSVTNDRATPRRVKKKGAVQ